MLNKLIKKYRSLPIAAKATLWFVFCSTLQRCVSLITTPVFTRIMSTEQFGQFSVYNSWLQIFTIITTLRLNYAVFNKGMSKYKDDRDSYTSTMQILTFGITLLVFLFYLFFMKAVNTFTELPTFIMIALFVELLFTPAIDFWTIRKRYEYIYKPVVFRTILMTVLNAGVGIVVVLLCKEKGYARILTCIAVNLIFGISLFMYNMSKAKKKFVPEYAKFALLFNLPLLLHYFSQYILDQFDKIMIQKMVGISAAGIYSVAYSAGLIMKIVTQSVNNALVPWQYGKLEKQKVREMDNTMFLVYIFIAGCSLLFSAFAPEIMMILADSKYYDAIYVVPAIALSMFFTFAYTTFSNVQFFFNKNKFTMYISMSGAILNILLNYVCIKHFGYIAAAYTTLACYVLFSAAHYIYMNYNVKKLLGEENGFQTGRLLLLSAGVLVCGLIVIAVYDYMFIRYAIILTVILAAYFNRARIIEEYKKVRKKKDSNDG